MNCIVALKNSKTIGEFKEVDSTVPEEQQAIPYLGRIFEIGKFLALEGDFPARVLERLLRCPIISEITPNLHVQALVFSVQENAPAHLARLSHPYEDEHDFSYYYDDQACGTGVQVYVIDSGINIEHPQFEERAIRGMNLVLNEVGGDQNGHGTHVAGIVGSRTYGVSKNVTIVDVKALDRYGAGTLSHILAALEYVARDQGEDSLSVINMSLGAQRNTVLNEAIRALEDMGVVVVAAAGNSNVNACKMSPASSRYAITVGAMNDTTGTMADFTNWGPCVDIFTSGTNVQSLNALDTSMSQFLSGTSMAAPIISGLAANLLSKGVVPNEVKQQLLENSHRGDIRRKSFFSRWRTPNRIAMGFQAHELYSAVKFRFGRT